MEWVRILLTDANVRWVLGGTLLLGISSGLLGSFAMLRRRSLMGDVLAHTALPGVAVAFLLTQTKSVLPLLVGAVVAGLLGTWCIDIITRYSRIKEDTAQGMVLSVFFGLGTVLLTHIAQSGAAGQSGLNRFLFGQAASLVGSDVRVIATVAFLLTLLIVLFFKEFKVLTFDPGFGGGMGLNVRALDRLLMLMVVVGVSIGLQAVGVVLMAALLVTPAAAARYWTDRLGFMLVLAAVFGGLSGVIGTVISLFGPRLATGPLIVLAATTLFLVSLTFGTRGGLLQKTWRHLRVRQRVAWENLLRALYEAYEQAGGAKGAVDFELRPIAESHLAERTGKGPAALRRTLLKLERLRWVTLTGEDERTGERQVLLTAEGLTRAQEVTRRHRLWEMYLMYEADFQFDHVDRDADDIEHHLPPDVVAELERRLQTEKGEAALPPSVHPL